MPGVFISYRREDCPGHAGRLFDRIRARFGADAVFMDVAAIEPGVDFVEVLHRAVGSCDALLAVIGREWLSCADRAGRRRLDDPHDFIRLEIGGALSRNVRVIPVLVDGAVMPATQELPDDLQGLTRRQAVELRDARWDADIDQLIVVMERILAGTAREPAAPMPPEGSGTVLTGPASGSPRRKRAGGRLAAWAAGVVLLAAAGIGYWVWYSAKPPLSETASGGKAPSASPPSGTSPQLRAGVPAAESGSAQPAGQQPKSDRPPAGPGSLNPDKGGAGRPSLSTENQPKAEPPPGPAGGSPAKKSDATAAGDGRGAGCIGVNVASAASAGVDGVLVRGVMEGGPAARAGMMTGDFIMAFGGDPVTDPSELTRRVAGSAPDARVPVVVLRGSRKLDLQVAVGEDLRARFEGSAGSQAFPVPDFTGKPVRTAVDAIKRMGGAYRVSYREDRSNKAGMVLSQSLDYCQPFPKDRTPVVVLNVAASGTLVIDYSEGEKKTADGLAAFLRAQRSMGTWVIRTVQSVPRREVLGRVCYSDPQYADTAAGIAKDAGAWLSREFRRQIAIEPCLYSPVVSKTLILGLPSFSSR